MAGATPTTVYPPTTTTTIASPPTVPATIGLGHCETITLSGFKANTTVTIALNGVPYTVSATSDANGNVVIVSCVTADLHISINGGPAVAANFGVNAIVVSDGTTTRTVSVDIPKPSSTTSGQSLAFTGADIATMSIGTLVLIAAGGLLIASSRRRSTKRSTR